MMGRFDKTVSGSSANTGRAVLQLGRKQRATRLELPPVVEGIPPEFIKLLNERLRVIDDELARIDDDEISLATKSGYGSIESVGATATPIPGAKVTLDKIGNWEIRIQAQVTAACEVFAVVDPQATETAIKQAAKVVTSGAGAASGSCLFTTTTVPRLVQLYAKSSAAADVEEEGTRIDAVWVGRYAAGGKRHGRQTPNQFAAAVDATGEALTAHGEEARWPSSDHPDTMPEGISQPGL